MSRQYYSQRNGTNPNMKGLPLDDVIELFIRVFNQLRSDGYFDEAFGFICVDAGDLEGKVRDPELEMLLTIRKKGLWPIPDKAPFYQEDDLFDVLEFLYQHVSKPIEGRGVRHALGDIQPTFRPQGISGEGQYRAIALRASLRAISRWRSAAQT